MILKLLSTTAAVLALTVQQHSKQFTLALPDRTVSVKYSNGATVFKGAPIHGEPGQPSLPVYKVTFLLPEGVDPKDVVITIENPIEEVLPGTYDIKPARPPSAYGETNWPAGKNIRNGMDMDVYGKDAFFPADFKGSVTFGKMRQYQLTDVVLNPFRYNPVTHQLKRIADGMLTLTFPEEAADTEKNAHSGESISKKADGKVEKFIKNRVVNPEVINSYAD